MNYKTRTFSNITFHSLFVSNMRNWKIKIEQNHAKIFVLKMKSKSEFLLKLVHKNIRLKLLVGWGLRKSLEHFILVRCTIFNQTSTNSSICEGSENNNRNQ